MSLTPPPFPRRNALDALADAVTDAAHRHPFVRHGGPVTGVTATHLRVGGLPPYVGLGDAVTIDCGRRARLGEVIRIDADAVTVKPFEPLDDLGLGALAWRQGPLRLAPDLSWKGRIIDPLGRPIDGGPPVLAGPRATALDRDPPAAMSRARVVKPIKTGIRAIDVLTPLCAGQRIGIFAGSGVGKSTLLAMMARARGFDSIVLALVGERGREVREFLEEALHQDRTRAVAVVSTSNDSAMLRRLAPRTAMTIAEHFRDAGENVLLIVDSITRFAHAAREVALSAGEPPVSRGYTPSLFAELPRLLERAGPGSEGSGSITGIFSVLVDGDDHNDPIADSIRGTLDGHIVLDRQIAAQGRFPAVDPLGSVSRLAQHAWTPDQAKLVSRLKAMIARYEETRDIRLMGGYKAGTDAGLDTAVNLVPKLYDCLVQSPAEPESVDPFKDIARALTAGQQIEEQAAAAA